MVVFVGPGIVTARPRVAKRGLGRNALAFMAVEECSADLKGAGRKEIQCGTSAAESTFNSDWSAPPVVVGSTSLFRHHQVAVELVIRRRGDCADRKRADLDAAADGESVSQQEMVFIAVRGMLGYLNVFYNRRRRARDDW
jgi:hypothetical protein